MQLKASDFMIDRAEKSKIVKVPMGSLAQGT
jgi:hypothetical protein